jgi:alanine racemase
LHSGTIKPVRVWIKADTGMHRLGMKLAELDDVLNRLMTAENVHSDITLCTHLACADDLNNPVTLQQVNLIREYAGKYNLPLSIANSAGIMAWPQSHAEWNRPGYMLYGNSPLGLSPDDATELLPAMTLTSQIISIKELLAGDGVGYGLNWVAKQPTKVATISIGYADGYPRHARNGTPVLVNGQRTDLVGTVSMDMITVDLTDVDDVDPDSSVELWGADLPVNEVASCAGTIGYELLTGLTGRLPISYLP